MKREHILSLLYDLTLTIGGEVRLDALLTKVLQRLLFHTAFPAGVMLMTSGEAGSEAPGSATPGQASSGRAILTASVGDHGLAASVGQPIDVPRHGWTGTARSSTTSGRPPGCARVPAPTGTC